MTLGDFTATDTSYATTRAVGRNGTQIALVLIALAMGGFAIGITEFAAMSILPDFARGLGVDEPTASHAISAYAAGGGWGRRCWRCSGRGCRDGYCWSG